MTEKDLLWITIGTFITLVTKEIPRVFRPLLGTKMKTKYIDIIKYVQQNHIEKHIQIKLNEKENTMRLIKI